MTELAKAIVFECAYDYWARACGQPDRPAYMRQYLQGRKK